MTVGFVSASAWHDGTTGLTADKVLTLPSHSTGDIILVLAAWKTYTITAQISGYTEITQFADGAVASGNGSGSMKVGAWYKVAASGAESNPTLDFSSTTTLVGEACVLVFSQSAGTWQTPLFATAAWPSSAGQAVNASSSLNMPAGGAVAAIIGIADDSATFTRGNLIGIDSPAGNFSAAYVEAPATHASTTTGNDMAADAGYRLISTAGSSQTLRSTATLTAAETGAVLWVVLGDVSASVTVTPTTAALVITENAPTVTVSNHQRVTVPLYGGSNYVTTVLADSPTFVLPLDEASGNLTDIVASKTATAFGSPTYGLTGPVTGHTAVDFPASTASYFTVPDHADLDLGASGFTIELWYARDTDNAAWQVLLSKEGAAYFVAIDANDHYAFGRSNIGSLQITTATVAANSAWHHYVLVRDAGADSAGETRIYIDGVNQALGTDSYASALSDSTSALYVGKEVAGSPAAGKIAYVALYKSALPEARVDAHYAAATVTGGLALTTYAPTIRQGTAVIPTTKALTLATFAPTVRTPILATPTTKALTATKYAPTVTAPAAQTVIPGTAAITTTKYAPTVTAHQHVTVTPTTAALADTQFAPTVTVSNHQRVTPTTASLAATKYAPTVRTPILATPTTKALVATKYAPTVRTPQTVTPAVKALTTTKFAPTITNPQTYVPTTAALTATKYAPTVSVSAASTIVVPNASLAITCFAPTVTASNRQIATPATAAITTTRYAPTISTPQTVTPTTKTLTATKYAPTVTASSQQGIVPGTKALAITRYAPTVSVTAHVSVVPSTKVLQLTKFAPSARVANRATPASKALTITTLAPIVTPTLNTLVRPAPFVLTITRYAPVLGASGHQYPEPATATLVTTGYAPTVEIHSNTPLPEFIYGFAIVATGDSGSVGTAQGGATVTASEGGSTAVSMTGPSARVTIR